MSSSWNLFSDASLMEYLEGKGIQIKSLLLGVNDLRNIITGLYIPERRTSNYIVHHVVPLPILIDKDRRNHVVIPFAQLGFI